MPDEQIIYLDPNDELTRVREKIEEVPARRIIMVVPQQTQLRSNVGWRLLHARARELGKEVQVISPDRQVRAVAKAAGFRTSQPQEGSSTGRTRVPPSQNPRSTTERRGIQRQRGPVNRGPVDSRSMRQRAPLPPPPPVIEELPTDTRPPQSTWHQQENAPAYPEEPTSRQGQEEAYPPVEIIEDDAFDQPFEFGINEQQAPTARPLTAHPDEEEHEDPYKPDYDMAWRIRQAAQEGTAGGASNPPSEEPEPASAFPTSHYSAPPAAQNANPFEGDIEEFSPSLLPEQHGPTFAPDVDDIAPDVTDIPTDVHKIEFLDDQDLPGNSQDFPARQWDNTFFNEPDEEVPAPASDTRVRGSRSDKLQRIPDEDDDFLPPPPSDQPTLIRSNRPRPSGALNVPRAGSRSAPLPAEAPPPVRKVNTRPMPQPQSASRPVTRSRIPAAPPPRRQPRRASRGRGGRVATIVIVVLLLLLLVGIGFLYYGTTATVTITVPSKTISLPSIKLTASTKTQSKFPNSVASQSLIYNASVTGTGTATGTTKQGNSNATGTVIFTNNNAQQYLTIPTGTVISTNAGAGSVQFVTTASPVIPPANASVPIPVQAQDSGSSGNVGAGTITVVPATSIATIAQASKLSSAQVNLTVTNPGATSGGGAAQVATVTQNDLQNLKNSLHSQLQTQVKNWLRGQLQPEDIAGTLSPDVVGSAQSLPEEQLTQVPAVGAPLTDKTFTGTLSTKITVLVVRHKSLTEAVQSQLNAAALATKPRPYTLDMQAQAKLSNVTSTSSKDGSTINITLAASGLAMLQVNTQELSKYLTGKTIDQAHSDIASGNAGPTGVEDIKIEVSPSFLSIMPFRSEHIHIDVIPGAQLPKG